MNKFGNTVFFKNFSDNYQISKAVQKEFDLSAQDANYCINRAIAHQERVVDCFRVQISMLHRGYAEADKEPDHEQLQTDELEHQRWLYHCGLIE